MAADSTAVRIGYAGAVYVAPVGTVAPVGFAAWGTGWVDMGLISDDGLTEGKNMERNEHFAWGYDAPVRTQVIRKVTTFGLTFIETNAVVLSVFHSVPLTDMTSTGTGAAQIPSFTEGQSSDPDVRALGVDIVDGSRQFRFVIPRCEATDRESISYKSDSLAGYGTTFTALLASDGTTMLRSYGQVALPA